MPSCPPGLPPDLSRPHVVRSPHGQETEPETETETEKEKETEQGKEQEKDAGTHWAGTVAAQMVAGAAQMALIPRLLVLRTSSRSRGPSTETLDHGQGPGHGHGLHDPRLPHLVHDATVVVVMNKGGTMGLDLYLSLSLWWAPVHTWTWVWGRPKTLRRWCWSWHNGTCSSRSCKPSCCAWNSA